MFLATLAPFVPTRHPVVDLHAPDGFLSLPVALAMWALTIVVLGLAVARSRDALDERAVPLMGVTAAFIFAAQMFTFPVAGGTSGHLLGGVLAAILLGPWVGTLIMAAVITVQALVFQDGGLLALGANIFDMGAVGTLAGYAIYRVLCALLGGEERGRLPAAGIAAWAAVMLGALAMSLQLALSGTSPLGVVLPAMLSVHVFIGIGEAFVTVGALILIQAVRPDLLRLRDRPRTPVSMAPGAG
jgi:cobalt/nickel transport system permease protein